MELDKALTFAVILAWEDLMKVTNPCSARVEYRCEPGTSLDYLSVWAVSPTSTVGSEGLGFLADKPFLFNKGVPKF